MYVRFTVPVEHGGTVTRMNIAPGPFRIASGLLLKGDRDSDPVVIALRRELDWFNDELPVPRRFQVRARRVWWSDGVCWFRDDSREMLAHMHALVSLVEEIGVPVTRSWTRDPGQLLYRTAGKWSQCPKRGGYNDRIL